MALLFKHFWIAFILATFANGAIWWARGKPHRERDPSLEEGYRSLILGLLTFGSVPSIIMGAGIVFGGVPSVFHYLNPRSTSPFIIGFFVSVLLVWVATTYWLFARSGAEKLIRHPGLLRGAIPSPSSIKILWLLCLLGGIAGVTAMYAYNLELPDF